MYMITKTATQHAELRSTTGNFSAAPPDLQRTAGRRRRHRRVGLAFLGALALGGGGCQDSGPAATVDMGPTMGVLSSSVGTSPPLTNSPQDAAIWVSSVDPTKSLVFATERVQLSGRLYSYSLGGQNVQSSALMMQPGLVDIKTGFTLGGQTVDLAAVAEAGTALIRFFSIDRSSGVMTDITGFTDVFKDRTGDAAIPVGVALYRRSSDNVGFVVVSPKSGPMTNYLYQYRLDYAAGKINLAYIRQFGDFSTLPVPGSTDVKGLLVDDAAGYLYYSDKSAGIRKYAVDPDAANANQELALFGQSEFLGDRNGLAIYGKSDGTGYLLSVDQTPNQSRILFWPRQGAAGSPHTHTLLSTLNLNADFIDGIEVTSAPLGSSYPSGLLVVSNRSGTNFLYYNWQAIASALQIK